MHRDSVEVHFILDDGAEGEPAWTKAGTGYLFLTVRDINEAHAEVTAKGIPLSRGLQQENWPARGFCLLDPSGNEIRLAQPL